MHDAFGIPWSEHYDQNTKAACLDTAWAQSDSFFFFLKKRQLGIPLRRQISWDLRFSCATVVWPEVCQASMPAQPWPPQRKCGRFPLRPYIYSIVYNFTTQDSTFYNLKCFPCPMLCPCKLIIWATLTHSPRWGETLPCFSNNCPQPSG